MNTDVCRCAWVSNDPLYREYHDKEWGVPSFDDAHLFEMLILEGAQAGLNWITVLKKRENYRRAFSGFDPEKIACYTDNDRRRLLKDEGIIRNKLKIDSTIKNAQAFLKLQAKAGSFADWLWPAVEGKPLQNAWPNIQAVPAQTPLSKDLSKALQKKGFNFVGPTIMYAFMQAVGMVNDHTTDCYRHAELRS